MNINTKRQMTFLSKFPYPRESGTPGESTAAATIQKELTKYNIKTQSPPFTFKAFTPKASPLSITAPHPTQYPITPYHRCGSTPPEGIEAPFLYAENGDEISLSHAKGKIVMLNNPLNKATYSALITAGAAGFLTITGTPLDEGIDRIPQSYTLPKMPSTPIQGASIHYKDAVEIVTKGAARARLIIQQEEVTLTSRNITARIPGTDKGDEILTLTAHYDTVPQSPGAYDNMSACAILLELCCYFKENPPRRTLEFIWFGAEEKGLLGSRNYVETHKNELKNHRFNMNVDLAGQLVGGNVIGVTGDASICTLLTNLARETGIGVTTRHQVWASDSNTFAWKGIPAITLNRDGFGMHTRHDVQELISPWSLQRSTLLLGHIAEYLANVETIPFPREIPAEFMTQLDAYFGCTE